MADRPNLLLVFADQMRGEAMGSVNPQVLTPHLDRLAGEGVRFSNAVAECPLCTPSRAMLLTGKYPLGCRTVLNDLPMPVDQTTFAHVMGGEGYRTGYVGKWHLDGFPRSKFTPPGPRRQGFDDYWAAYNCTHLYFEPRYYLDTPELVRAQGYEPDVQTDLALGFLERYRQEPFCLVVSWGPPHNPYQMVPEQYRARYYPEKLALRPNVGPDANRRAIADYYAAVTALDANLGRLLAALERLGLAERTMVVFTSDHGDLLWSHGRTDKQAPWEESISIPLIMRYPGVLPGADRGGRPGAHAAVPGRLPGAGRDGGAGPGGGGPGGASPAAALAADHGPGAHGQCPALGSARMARGAHAPPHLRPLAGGGLGAL